MNRRFFLRNTALTVFGTGVVAAVPMHILATVRKSCFTRRYD
jgi:hypothetical protein